MAAMERSEIEAYLRDGYVVPEYRLPTAKVAELAGALEVVIENNPGIRPEQLAGVHLSQGPYQPVKGHQAFLDMALDRELADLVAGVLGENLVLWGCQIFCKPGLDGMEVPMHQDGQYWPIRPMATCTVWIAIDDSDRENGCLTVLPGSHRAKTHYEHATRGDDNLVLNQAVVDEKPLAIEPVHVELEAGQMSLHDIYLVHGSAANVSGRRRAGLTVRFMPSTSWFRRDMQMPFSGYQVDFSHRPIWLVKGRDVCGKNDFDIGHEQAIRSVNSA